MSEKGVEELKESKGGIKYELVLEKPTSEPPVVTRDTTSPSRQLSVEEIEQKLKAAEERRKSMEEKRLSQLKEKDLYIETLKEKKNELIQSKVETAREILEKKMEVSKENRENYIKGIQDKSREHHKLVESRSLSQESDLEKELLQLKLEKKQAMAAENREAQIAALKEKLKEHDKKLHDLKLKMSLKFNTCKETLAEKLDEKLKCAEENRNALQKQIQDRIQEHEKRIAEVRQNRMSTSMTEDSNATEMA